MKMRESSTAGFSLTEVALALGVVTFCLVPLLGLLLTGLNSSNASSKETESAYLTTQIVNDLRATQLSAAKSPFYGFTVPVNGTASTMTSSTGIPQTIYVQEDGSATGPMGSTPTASSRYRISLGFLANSSNPRTAPLVRVLITWPAQADSNPIVWPNRFSGSYETVVGLGCNQ